MRFSVVVLSYKSLEYIKENIDSILNQDYPDIEIIISDDCTPGFECKEYEKYINKLIT